MDRGKILGIFPITRWPAQDSRNEDELRQQISNVLLAGAEPTARVAAVITVLTAADMLKSVVAKPDLKAAKARGEEISAGNWAGDSVRKTIKEMQAATTAAVMVATTATVIATSG